MGQRFFFFHFLDSAVLASSGGSSPFESELCNRWWRGIIRVFGFFELDSRVEPPVVYGRGASVEDVLGEAQGFFCFFWWGNVVKAFGFNRLRFLALRRPQLGFEARF